MLKAALNCATLAAFCTVQEINSKPSAKQKHLLTHQPSLTEVILMCTSGRE